jgi:hypothetical protein
LKMFPLLERFLPFEIAQMIEDIGMFAEHDPKPVKPDGIGYVDPSKGSICTETTYGYRTAFAYLNFCFETKVLEYNRNSKKVGVRIFCGSHLYSNLPNTKTTTRILGLSATIEALDKSYDKILSQYRFNIRTIMPSTFAKQRLLVQSPILEDTVPNFYEALRRELSGVLARDRPSLVVFDTKQHLDLFAEHLRAHKIVDSGEKYKGFEVLSNETLLKDRDFIIAKAMERSCITLMTRSYGRGTDFKSRHPDVEMNGGVHVILTFLPESQSELVQIQGRTCRQNKSGSFRYILCKERIGDAVVLEGDLETCLGRLRSESECERVDLMFMQLEANSLECEESQRMAKAAASDVCSAANLLFAMQGYGAKPFSNGVQNIEVAMMMDCTGSMSSYINAAKDCVLRIVQQVQDGVTADNPTLKGPELENFVKMGFVAYRDWDSSGKTYDSPGDVQTFDLSSNITGLKSFISTLTASGGGDGPEDVAGGLRRLAGLSWSPCSAKIVFILADAPCHGTQYHGTSDNHPRGDPKGSVPEEQIFGLAAEGVRFFFVNINHSETDKMLSIWNHHLTSKGIRPIEAIEMNHTGANFLESFATQISKAILADYTSPAKQ